MPKYIELKEAEFTEYLPDITLLIVTATELETINTHETLKSIEESDSIYKVSLKGITLYIAKLGNYLVAHVQCTMGSLSSSSSILTITTALAMCPSIKAVIMVGIAFGIDNEKQKIGDVLISKSILPYDSKRIGDSKTIHRGTETPASPVLLDRLRALPIENKYSFSITQTRLLSGETLVDNLQYRNTLVKDFPDSKGGEMEGTGVASACIGKCEWVLIKAICDFGDGNKSKNKYENQKIAIKNSLSVLSDLLNSQEGLKCIGILPFKKKNKIFDSEVINKILFEIYSKDTELYYYARKFDEELSSKLKYFGIWVYGGSGLGKTNSILRYLSINNVDFCQVILAHCYKSPVEECFLEISYELAKHVTHDEESVIYPKSFKECIDLIKNAVKSIGEGKIIYLYIDEIPLGHNLKEVKEFSEKFHILLLALISDQTINRIKFVLSSIANPSILESDKVLHEKITQYIKFLDIHKWEQSDLNTLNETIINALSLKISREEKTLLLEIQNLSPRFLKRFYKNYLSFNKEQEKDFQSIINSTKLEYGNL